MDIGSQACYIASATDFSTLIDESLVSPLPIHAKVLREDSQRPFAAIMKIRFRLLRLACLAMMVDTTATQAATPVTTPGLWQITVVDFADRTSVVKECVKTPDWNWWIIYAGNTASDESCKPPVANVEGDVVTITQECKSVTAELLISEAGGGKISGNLTTSSLTPYGQAIPFHSKFEAQRLSADCP